MRLLTQLARIFVGVLFIFSGVIKLNDPLGFSYKLDEYFAPDVLNLPFLQPLALEFAIFVVILEVLLGVALLLGVWKKITVWLLFAMIVFFTFLTFYSAYFNKVTDCGCFGDAIPLTPWQSFGKDVILSVLIIFILVNIKHIRPLFSNMVSSVLMLISLIACSLFGRHVLKHLPVWDFRPYAEGLSIVEGMKSAEELGLQPTRYGTVYIMKNQTSGEEVSVGSDAYVAEKWYEKKDWEMLTDRTETVVLEKGYEPPVHDFILTIEDMDITDSILSAPRIFVLVSYQMEKTDKAAYTRINEFALAAEAAGIPFLGVTASLSGTVEQMRHELQTPFPFGTMDETTLKTVIRANPGILLLEEGTIVAKWHHNDLPEFTEVSKNLL
jgi:uncharacterized membrane protein YphA (DoxX/SURF4 family)